MKERKIEKVISGILIGILIILTIFMIADVKKLQGNARVVNYAGIIRGATQRMVKLEVVDEGNDELIQYLDDIFSGLMHGGGKYNLTHLEDTDYNAKLNRLYSYWAKLKEEVTKVREKGYKDTDIISMSEEYFQLADKMVDAAENCSQRYATQINQIEKALIVIMILIVALQRIRRAGRPLQKEQGTAEKSLSGPSYRSSEQKPLRGAPSGKRQSDRTYHGSDLRPERS